MTGDWKCLYRPISSYRRVSQRVTSISEHPFTLILPVIVVKLHFLRRLRGPTLTENRQKWSKNSSTLLHPRRGDRKWRDKKTLQRVESGTKGQVRELLFKDGRLHAVRVTHLDLERQAYP